MAKLAHCASTIDSPSTAPANFGTRDSFLCCDKFRARIWSATASLNSHALASAIHLSSTTYNAMPDSATSTA